MSGGCLEKEKLVYTYVNNLSIKQNQYYTLLFKKKTLS